MKSCLTNRSHNIQCTLSSRDNSVKGGGGGAADDPLGEYPNFIKRK